MRALLTTCLLLLSTLTVFASDEGIVDMTPSSDGIKLTCSKGHVLHKGDKKTESEKIEYKDDNSGEYSCKKDGQSAKDNKIFVKYRSCDNCVQLDMAAVGGMMTGDLVVTFMIAAAVYVIASQSYRIQPASSQKKSSDRQHLVSNEVSNRATNDHYQSLQLMKRDTYDVLANRR